MVWLAVFDHIQQRLKVLEYRIEAVSCTSGSRTLLNCSYETKCSAELLQCRTSDLTKCVPQAQGEIHIRNTPTCYYSQQCYDVPCYNQCFACGEKHMCQNSFKGRLFDTKTMPVCSYAHAHSMHACYADQRPLDTAEHHVPQCQFG